MRISSGTRLTQQKRALKWNFVRLALSISLTLLSADHAAAQYPGGSGGMPGSSAPGYTPPNGGYGTGKAIGIGVGAAAGVAVLYLALHHQGAVTGCVRSTGDGVNLVDEKNKKTYLIVPGSVSLKPGERVQLRGRKSKDEAGSLTLQPTRMVKNLGACVAEPASKGDSVSQ